MTNYIEFALLKHLNEYEAAHGLISDENRSE